MYLYVFTDLSIYLYIYIFIFIYLYLFIYVYLCVCIYCRYYAKGFKDDLGRCLDILSDILLNSTIDKEALEIEKRVILREMKEVEKQTEEVIFDRLHMTVSLFLLLYLQNLFAFYLFLFILFISIYVYLFDRNERYRETNRRNNLGLRV